MNYYLSKSKMTTTRQHIPTSRLRAMLKQVFPHHYIPERKNDLELWIQNMFEILTMIQGFIHMNGGKEFEERLSIFIPYYSDTNVIIKERDNDHPFQLFWDLVITNKQQVHKAIQQKKHNKYSQEDLAYVDKSIKELREIFDKIIKNHFTKVNKDTMKMFTEQYHIKEIHPLKQQQGHEAKRRRQTISSQIQIPQIPADLINWDPQIQSRATTHIPPIPADLMSWDPQSQRKATTHIPPIPADLMSWDHESQRIIPQANAYLQFLKKRRQQQKKSQSPTGKTVS